MTGRRTPSTPDTIPALQAQRIRRRLLAWFDRYKRDLPWRHAKQNFAVPAKQSYAVCDPYPIWLSEMMLQQTQVATVLPYYERFLTAFPTLRDLAAADLDDVLRLWAGLGYYARARNMHRAANMIVNEMGGKFPDTCDGLRRLPGVGPYSAAAIASIAFDLRAAVVDGNVIRVIARVFDLRADVTTSRGKHRITQLADALAPEKRCGDFNQAMMELGATVCRPGAAAQCKDCPLQKVCKALAAGNVQRLPIKKRRTRVTSEVHVVAAVCRNKRWLVVQRPSRGLWGGLWELPTVVANGNATARLATELANSWTKRTGSQRRVPFCRLVRQLSHRRIEFVGYRIEAKEGGDLPSRSSAQQDSKKNKARWLTISQLRALPMSTAMQSVVAELESSP